MTKKSKRKRSLICGKSFTIEGHDLEDLQGPILVKITKHIGKGKNKAFLRLEGVETFYREAMLTTEYSKFSWWAMINWNIDGGTLFYKGLNTLTYKRTATRNVLIPKPIDLLMPQIIEGVKAIMLESTILGQK